MDLKWKSLVLTNQSISNSTLRNSAFYSDEVTWYSTDFMVSELHLLPIGIKGFKLTELPHGLNRTELISHVCAQLTTYYYKKTGIDPDLIIKQVFNFYYHLYQIEEFNEYDFSVNKTDLIKVFRSKCGSREPIVFKEFESEFNEKFLELFQNLNVFHDDINPDNEDLLYQDWDPYSGVEGLLNALRKTQILPDISQLPIYDLRELKERTSAELELMRAELLRMTEDLRILVNGNHSTKDVLKESEYFIITRIEPVLREVASKTKSEMRSKFKKYFEKSIKTIGFIGMGFLNPKGFYNAMTEGVGMISEISTDNFKLKNNSATVNFALKMDSELSRIHNKR